MRIVFALVALMILTAWTPLTADQVTQVPTILSYLAGKDVVISCTDRSCAAIASQLEGAASQAGAVIKSGWSFGPSKGAEVRGSDADLVDQTVAALGAMGISASKQLVHMPRLRAADIGQHPLVILLGKG